MTGRHAPDTVPETAAVQGLVTRRRAVLVVRNSTFARVWGAQLLSQSATRMYQMGVLWWILGRVAAGERGVASGVFVVCAALPPVVFAPWIARVIARRSSRSVLMATVVAAGALAVTLAGFAAFAAMPTLMVYPVMLALAACQALFDPCLSKSIPELVDDADIEDATAFQQASYSLVGMAGALFGSVLVGQVGLVGLVTVSATCYLVAAALLTRARFSPAAGADGEEAVRGGVAQVWRLLEGLSFIRVALLCFAVANFFITATFLILPLYTKNVLHASALTLGGLEAALWLGMLFGVFTGKRLPGRPGHIGAACMALFGAALITPGFVDERNLFAACLVVAGWAVGATNAVFVALFQRRVPPAAKPVFFSAMLALLGVGFPLAALVFGLLGDLVSAQYLCLIQATGLLPVAAVLYVRSRSCAVALSSAPRRVPLSDLTDGER